MTTTIDTKFIKELQEYGSKNFLSCFDCGTCTAVCNLTEKDNSFPRYFVRLAKTGQTSEIVKARQIWQCYACGDCSQSCPRDADPAELIAALRRYTIARYEPTGITRLMFKNNLIYVLITLILAFVLALFMMTFQPETEVSRWIFNIISYETIHYTGIAVFVIIILSMIYGTVMSIRNYSAGEKNKNSFWKNLSEVLKEIAIFKRYQNCDTYDDSPWHGKSFLVKPWFIHFTIFWGFVGLFGATVLDYLFKNPATDVWWPTRILGTIAGLLLMYGSTLAMYYRLTKPTKIYEKSKMADWIFLIFIWLTGITGFWLEVAVMAGIHTLFNQYMLLIHTVLAMEMCLLLVFSKFAHALYRPIALYFYFATKKQ